MAALVELQAPIPLPSMTIYHYQGGTFKNGWPDRFKVFKMGANTPSQVGYDHCFLGDGKRLL